MRHIVASPSAVRLLNFGGFRLVKDVAKAVNARAAINFEFFSMSKNHPKDSYPVGLVIDEGAVITWPNDDSKHFSGVYRKDGKVIISEVIPPDSDWAVTAGPRLLQGGQVCERSISDSRWVAGGIQPASSSVARVAIGVKPDGKCVLAYWSGATIREMAAGMLGLGCVDALAGDGGGSGSWYDSEHPEDTVSQRATPNMIAVFGEVETDSKPVEVPEPAGGERPMIVCIDPGHGGPDPGCVGPDGTQEKHITLTVSLRVAEYLRRLGHTVILTRTTDTDLSPGLDDEAEMRARAKVSNDARADCLVSIHVNAASVPASGAEGLFWPGSVRGDALIGSIMRYSGVASGQPLRRIFGSRLMLHSYAETVTVTVELGFMSNAGDRALLKEPAWLDKYALGIAYGIHAWPA